MQVISSAAPRARRVSGSNRTSLRAAPNADYVRSRAKASGVKFGPKFKLSGFQQREGLARLAAGESQSVIAQTYGVDRATISRLHKLDRN
jgi:hypothetical protein